jgi:hypothetical protein
MSYMENVAGDILLSSLGQKGGVLLNDTTELKDASPVANKIVTITAFKVGGYTVAAQPPQTMNITVTHATVNTTDTLGTITVTGTSHADEVITEVITPSADSTVAGTKCFKTVTAVEGACWKIGGATADNITVGTGSIIHNPVSFRAIQCLTDTVFATLTSNITVNDYVTPATGAGFGTVSAGTTLYGRFTDIKLTSGTIMLYR